MSVLTTTPKFLYPHSRQFPFDEVAEEIVKALEKRNWKVPGITIEFDIYGSGEAKYKMVRNIAGDNFKLYFGRVQGRISKRYNDVAALHSICIPNQIIEVFEDESGPRYYLYVGKNWEEDKEWFMNSIKVHSKLENEPRRYLKYRGNTYKQRAKELVADNDLDREYSPNDSEPVSFNLEQKFNEFTEWLKEFVLEYILSFPEADTIEQSMQIEELIPYKGPWTTILSICNEHDAIRIKKGKEDPQKLLPEERHAYIGNGHRLVSLNVKCDGRFPKIAYEGFIWCAISLGKNVTQDEYKYVSKITDAMFSNFDSNYIVAIKLKYANQVYVVDNSKFEETRQKLFKDISPREILTDDELDIAYAARGATIVPITEYNGGYKEPIVLINRELEFEEIDGIFEIDNWDYYN